MNTYGWIRPDVLCRFTLLASEYAYMRIAHANEPEKSRAIPTLRNWLSWLELLKWFPISRLGGFRHSGIPVYFRRNIQKIAIRVNGAIFFCFKRGKNKEKEKKTEMVAVEPDFSLIDENLLKSRRYFVLSAKVRSCQFKQAWSSRHSPIAYLHHSRGKGDAGRRFGGDLRV